MPFMEATTDEWPGDIEAAGYAHSLVFMLSYTWLGRCIAQFFFSMADKSPSATNA